MIEVRTASTDDLDAIFALECAAFVHGRWSREAWADEVSGRDRCCVVAVDRAAVVGVATFQCVADTADLHRVIVEESSRGRGVGELLVRHGHHWAAREGATRMVLEVSEHSAPAVRLYRRLGYVEIARRNDYYSPGEAALVMEVTW